jgi:hypothetical protein
MEKIPEALIQCMREDLIGKRIKLKQSKHFIVGICDYLGYNEYFPSWGFCVNIDSTPYTNISLTDIELI